MKGIKHYFGLAVSTALLFLPACAEVSIAATQSAPKSATVTVDLESDRQNQFDDLNDQLENRSWFDTVADQTFHQDALILKTDRNASDVVLRRTETLLEHLSTKIEPSSLGEFQSDLRLLRQKIGLANTPARSEEDFRLFTEICRLRRKIVFANPLLNFDKILFQKSRFSTFQHCCHQ